MPLHCCQRWQAQTTVNWITVYSVVLIREKRCRSFLSCVFSIVWKTMSSCCWGTEVVLSILRLWPAFSSKWLWLQVAGITVLGVTLRDMNSSHRNGRVSLPKDICGWQISGQRRSVGIRCSVEVCACVFVFLFFLDFFLGQCWNHHNISSKVRYLSDFFIDSVSQPTFPCLTTATNIPWQCPLEVDYFVSVSSFPLRMPDIRSFTGSMVILTTATVH